MECPTFFLFSLCGWIGYRLIRQWKALRDHFVGPLLPLLIVYLVFCGVQAGLDYSGVLAVMATTLVMRCMFLGDPESRELPAPLMELYRGLWDFLATLVNAVLFFMLGVEIGAALEAFAARETLLVILALVLMLPRSYPYRAVFLWAALAVCLFTLIANTLAMDRFLAKCKLDDSTPIDVK